MRSIVQNKPHITTLKLKPGVTIWYARIPEIIRSIFSKTTYHSFRPLVNEKFTADDFHTPFLSTGEIKVINGFKAFKKQMEWICGRYLMKQMMHPFFHERLPLDRITLSYLDQGAPFLTDHPDIPISLSHSNDYTAAAYAADQDRTIGIDIEKIAEKPDIHFLKTAFTPDEILNLKDDAFDIFKHWTLKEAYLKYIKKGFNESLHKVEVIGNDIFHNKQKVNVEMVSTRIGTDYVLSLVSDAPHP